MDLNFIIYSMPAGTKQACKKAKRGKYQRKIRKDVIGIVKNMKQYNLFKKAAIALLY